MRYSRKKSVHVLEKEACHTRVQLPPQKMYLPLMFAKGIPVSSSQINYDNMSYHVSIVERWLLYMAGFFLLYPSLTTWILIVDIQVVRGYSRKKPRHYLRTSHFTRFMLPM